MKISLRRPTASDKPQETGKSGVSRLAELIKIYAPYDGSFELNVPGVHAIRRSRKTSEQVHGFAHSGLCVVAQGAKSVMLGREVFEYDADKMIVYSVDMPVTSQVLKASAVEPFLGLRLDLDPQRIADLTLKVYPHGLPPVLESLAIYLGQVDPKIVEATIRLLELVSQPTESGLLGPLVMDEILIRLLRSPLGPRVAQLGLKGSGLRGVSKAVAWIKDNFTQPIRIDHLAKLANMSASTFHTHFKSVTSMSPLQFQKVLRLQEARRLMLSSMKDAGIASREVGYVSASQFSREYSRFFGDAPTKDVQKFRELTMTGGRADE